MKKTQKIQDVKKPSREDIVVLKNQLARALADYDNLRKRIERERGDFEKLANLRLVIKLLPVMDALRQAQEHLHDPGLAITISGFEETLKAEGIEEIKAKKGDDFDSSLHEAVDVIEDGKDSGKIVNVALTGWKMDSGPVVRHAKFIVSK